MRATNGSKFFAKNQIAAARPRHALRRVLTALRRKRRSVLFMHHSYYHFFYLAQALRRRGWDAVNVSLEAPGTPHANYYHGEDINLFDADPERYRKNIEALFEEAKTRFELMHFAGDGYLSFFPTNIHLEDPPDILEWRALGKKIGYTASGCNSGVAQSSVMDWSALGGRKVCDRCVWQTNADVCNDERNLAWGRKLEKHCDLICGEMVPGLDYMALPGKATREPLTTCLDPDFWRPDLAIPADLKLTRERGEILVYHAFGNYDSRALNGRNIKGTPAIFDAIERLKAEGEHVRLIFVTTEHNKQVRYSQAQADIIVDQLNYGRYGATAREGMMLGKPVICYINAHEMRPQLELACLRECPLVSATEDTVYATLKVLLANPVLRHDIGKAGRRYAMKWHSADACAERYEKVYDRLLAGLPPVAEEPAASIAADA